MSNLLLNLLEDYKKYSIYRNHIEIDGLLPIERRLLLTVKNMPNNFIKSARIVGECMANYHPHSDQSIYKTLIKMTNQGFFEGQGNFGADGLEPIPPAAMRYTEVKFNKRLDFIFDLIKFADVIEKEYEKEPAYLPVPFPLLLGKKEKIGLSFYKSSIPLFDFENLIKIQKKLLGLTNQKEYELLPNTGNFIITKIDKTYLSKTEFTVELIVKHEKNGNTITIYDKPVFLEQLKKDQNITLTDYSDKDFKVIIKVKDNVNYLEKFLKKTIRYNIIRYNTEEENIEKISLETLFKKAWYAYCKAMEKKLNEDLKKLEESLNYLILLKNIKNKFKNLSKLNREALLKAFPNDKQRIEFIIRNFSIEKFLEAEILLEKTEVQIKELKSISPETLAINKLKSLN